MTPMIPCTNQVMAQMDARHRRIIAVIMPPPDTPAGHPRRPDAPDRQGSSRRM